MSSSSIITTTETLPQQKPEPKRRGRKARIPRTICPICKLPAVAYPHYRTLKDGVTRRKAWHFEHRDEPPIRLYKYHGQTYKVYRRCTSRTVDSNGLDLDRLISAANKQYTKQQEQQPLQKEDLYKKLYCNLLDEIKNLQLDTRRLISHYPDPRKTEQAKREEGDD